MLYGRSRLAASHTLGRMMMHPGWACDALWRATRQRDTGTEQSTFAVDQPKASSELTKHALPSVRANSGRYVSYLLLADDNEEMRLMLRDLFRSAGHEVDLVEDGLAVLTALQGR